MSILEIPHRLRLEKGERGRPSMSNNLEQRARKFIDKDFPITRHSPRTPTEVKHLMAAFARAELEAVEHRIHQTLCQHWLSEVVCKHSRKTDQALCSCGWRGAEYDCVGDAVASWANHVTEQIGERQR